MGGAAAQALDNSARSHGVQRATLTALARQLRPVEFRRGQTIVVEGEPGDRMYIIVNGKAKVGRCTADGRRNLLAVLGPTDVFGELSVFDCDVRTSTVTALTTLTAVAIDRADLSTLLITRPELAEQLLQVLARRLRDTHDNVTDVIFTDVPGRVAKLLLHLAGRFGVKEPGSDPDRPVVRVPHDLTQEELAQLVGASREAVNKALGEFVERGWIELFGKTVIIAERARLARRAR